VRWSNALLTVAPRHHAETDPSTWSWHVKILGTPGLDGIEPATVERQAIQAATGNSSKKIDDSVTFSSAARQREAASTHPRFGALSVQAHLDRDLADRLAYDYAHVTHRPIIDLTDEIAGTGPAKYAATGEPVTSDRDARYGPLRREGLIVGWSDQAICPGSDWRNEIEEHLNRAQIILLLVSV
jgi:hypothetical protein